MVRRGRRGEYVARNWAARPAGFASRLDRKTFQYQAFLPHPIAAEEFELAGDVVGEIEAASASIAQLNAAEPRLESLEALAGQLLRSESLASSRIEGLVVSHRRLALAAAGMGRPDHRADDILGNIRAMQEAILVGRKPSQLDVADLLRIHELLRRFTEDERIAGRVRDAQGWIRFSNRRDLSALLQAAVAHAQFELIHPFADGNGRAGRCLIHVVLGRRGLTPRFAPPISLILAAREREYIAGLEGFREGRLDEWLRVFCAAAATAALDARRLNDRVESLQRAWIDRFTRGPRVDSAVLGLIRRLPGRPVVQITTVQRELGVSDRAAAAAVRQLESVGCFAGSPATTAEPAPGNAANSSTSSPTSNAACKSTSDRPG